MQRNGFGRLRFTPNRPNILPNTTMIPEAGYAQGEAH